MKINYLIMLITATTTALLFGFYNNSLSIALIQYWGVMCFSYIYNIEQMMEELK